MKERVREEQEETQRIKCLFLGLRSDIRRQGRLCPDGALADKFMSSEREILTFLFPQHWTRSCFLLFKLFCEFFSGLQMRTVPHLPLFLRLISAIE